MIPRTFVADNSVIMAWCFEDETSPYAETALRSLKEGGAVVPAIWPLEFGNALLVAERRRRITGSDIVRFLELVHNLPITVDREDSGRALTEIMALARELKLSTYDASYLDLAMRSGLPIATQDKLLVKAAKKRRVPLFNEGRPHARSARKSSR